MMQHLLTRYARLVVLATLCLTPLLVTGALKALQGDPNNIRQWLPQGMAETQQYDFFLEHFGSEEMAVVSWPGATLSDPRIERLAEALRDASITAGTAPAQDQRLFKSVVTAHDVLDQLQREPLELSRTEALARVKGLLVGPDGETTGIVALVSSEGAQHRQQAIETIQHLAASEAGVPPSELRLGGPTVDTVALNQESARSRYQLAGLSVIFALALAWRCLRRLQLVVVVFATALLCTIASVAIVYVTGERLTLVLGTMPTLVYVLAISGAIHLTNYYRDAIQQGHVETAPWQALRTGWLPCTLAAGTTALGLGSLGFSDVEPVKLFGIYSAAGVLCSLGILFVFLPSVYQLWPLKAVPAGHANGATKRRRKARNRWSLRLACLVTRYHVAVVAGCAVLMLVVGSGLGQLNMSIKLLNLFKPEARIIQDYAWLEKHLGPLVPVEVVLRVQDQGSLSMVDRVQMVRDVQQQLDAMDEVGGTMSAAMFAPTVPRGAGLGQTIQRRIAEKKLARGLPEFEKMQLVQDLGQDQLWRVSARVEALNALDYGLFVQELREQVQPVLEAYSNETVQVDAIYTGIVPLIYKAQRQLLNDLTSSFLAAFLLVAVVMVALLRGLSAGLISMLPNIFPAVVIFGAMGWLGQLVDIGSMMTASVALGIAVDDTIHFLSWFRRGLRSGCSRQQAIRLAYRSCAGAMVQTTVICGLGLLVFSLSSFVPTSRFATLMCVMLTTALVGDLLFLPALLASPAGKFFAHSGSPLGRWKGNLTTASDWFGRTVQTWKLRGETV